jgi:hypothetical protein
MALVTQAEFARLHGVSRKTATKWKEAGRLVIVGDRVDVEKSDALLRDAHLGRFKETLRTDPGPPSKAGARKQTGRRATTGAKEDSAALSDAGTIHEFLTQLLNGNYASQAEAERVKENALAGVRALELQRKAGALVEIEIAERALFEVFRASRDSWLNWPSRIGPMMAADLGLPPEKVVEALTRYVHEHLAELGEPAADFSGEA